MQRARAAVSHRSGRACSRFHPAGQGRYDRPMRLRLILPIASLFGLLGAAQVFHGALTARARRRIEHRADRAKGDVLELRVGGQLPRLQIVGRRKRQERGTRRRATRPPEPELPVTRRWVTLREGETVYGICRRVLGDARRFQDVLALNHLTEEGARRLQPGTIIYLP